MSDSQSATSPDFLEQYTRKQAEAEREEAATQATFETRVAGPARQLRLDWDAAWLAVALLLEPVWSALRRGPASGPQPEPSSLAAALQPVGEALARLDVICESRFEINPSLRDFTLKARGIPPSATARLALVRDDRRFSAPAPRAAAELLVRAVTDTAEDLSNRVRGLLTNDVLRVAFGWLSFMRDCIFPDHGAAPRESKFRLSCGSREDPIGAGPAADWRQQIMPEDYERVEILLAVKIPDFTCDLFPEWNPEAPAPSTVGELRVYSLSARHLLPVWNWTDGDYDYGPKLRPLWEHVVRAAGGRPYPPLGEGCYDLVRAQAAIDRVVQWCDERMNADSGEGEKPPPDETPVDRPFQRSSTEFGLRWKNREHLFDSSEKQSFDIISTMWPPVQGARKAVADVQEKVGSEAKHAKWATNVASRANEVLGKFRIPFKLIGNKKEGGILQWKEVSDGIS